MKVFFYSTVVLFLFLTSCSPTVYVSNPRPVAVQPPPVNDAPPQTDQMFYDELSPYGQWVDYPEYGYVWKPNVGADFRPYATNGHWVYSDAGWTWVSDFNWGWAAFHYGRWFHDDGYGWMWLPGRQWAPAWVTWGQSGSDYGWAAIPPKEDVNTGWRPKNEDWNFVPAEHMTKPNISNYVIKNNVTVISKTVIINNVANNKTTNNTVTNNNNTINNNVTNNKTTNNTVTNNNNITNNNVTNNKTTNNTLTNNINTNNNTTNNNTTNNHNTNIVNYNKGPKVNEVENITNVKIQQVKINEGNKPGQTVVNNNQVTIFRPVIKENKPQQNKPAPKKIETYKPGGNQKP